MNCALLQFFILVLLYFLDSFSSLYKKIQTTGIRGGGLFGRSFMHHDPSLLHLSGLPHNLFPPFQIFISLFSISNLFTFCF